MQKYYFELILSRETYQKASESEELKKIPVMGIEEFSMVEVEVDNLLGERSYSGGDLPESVLDEVVDFQESNPSGSVKIYFENSENAQQYLNLISNLFGGEHELTKKEYEDWNEEWKNSYVPIEIDESNILIPSWYNEAEFEHKNIVKIYPGMGFGTGSHETTYLCLKLLVEDINIKNIKTCMDYGCGSGILAIFANKIKLLDHTDYYDIDQEALENSKINIEINKLKHSHQLLLPKKKEKFLEGYDLVFANILQNVLLNEKKYISQISKRYLIISGLLNGQESEVISQYNEFKLIKKLIKNDWCALLMERI
jgi:ribosomal protein L11 methyltransferase